VARSADGGRTWTRHDLPISLSDIRSRFFQSVYFIDSLNIILTGDSGLIYRSFDGGSTWKDQSFPSPAAAGSPAFLDSAYGAIVMGGGTVIRTSDAGETWTPIPGMPYRALNSPHWMGRDTLTFSAVGRNALYVITQRGLDSVELPFDRRLTDTGGYRSLSSIVWFGNEEVVAFGTHYIKDSLARNRFRQLIARSTDAGRTWSQVLDRDFGDHIYGGALDQTGAGVMFGDLFGALDRTRDWRSGAWTHDSVISDSEFHEISQAIYLDSENLLGLFDNGTIIVGPSSGFVATFKLPQSRRVEYWEATVRNTLIYPNPVSTFLNVTVPVRSGHLGLINILGREATHFEVTNGVARSSVMGLADGVYSLMLDREGHKIPLGKVLVKH
jgi:hypothetical protein